MRCVCHDGSVTERIHDSEPDLSEGVVRMLLQQQRPEWADRPLRYLDASGTTNVLYHVATADGADVALRLPRTPSASASIQHETELLPALAATSFAARITIPTLAHHGEPTEEFPFHWAALTWCEGEDLWNGHSSVDQQQLATDLGQLVVAIGGLTDLPAPIRGPGDRGGPIGELLDTLHAWLSVPAWNAKDLVDVVAISRLADEARELETEPYDVGFVHGDLIPGNLLTSDGRISAIIDWGAAGYGDLAQDLSPAWAVFDEPARQQFCEVVGRDDESWLRARTNELEHTVGGIVYYRPRGHALADVMTATLNRILDEAGLAS